MPQRSTRTSKALLAKWKTLDRQVIACKKCPRLIEHCKEVATVKRRAYQDVDYWGKPVPNFYALTGQETQKRNTGAALLIVGLAPGAHGANRTGRMFSGDRSGDWLFRALFRGGFASQEQCVDRQDGLELINCAITNVCHCAPPQNKVTAEEVANCRPFLESTMEIARPKVVLALGKLAWDQIIRFAKTQAWFEGAKPQFGHAAEKEMQNGTIILASYHPSQQNTFTGRLTEEMLDAIINRAKVLTGC